MIVVNNRTGRDALVVFLVAAAVSLNACKGDDTPTQPDVSYRNCDEVRAAGKAPIKSGDPGFRSELDRDGDGVACDK